MTKQEEKCSCLTDDGFADIICRRCNKPKQLVKGAGDDYPVYSIHSKLYHSDTTQIILKQSIEEVANRECEILFRSKGTLSIEFMEGYLTGFIAGAKWKEEQSYTLGLMLNVHTVLGCLIVILLWMN